MKPTPLSTPIGQPINQDDRPHPSWAGFDRTELQVPHSLKNHSDALAVSVHLYRDMDGVSERQQVAAADKFERFKPLSGHHAAAQTSRHSKERRDPPC